MKIKLTAGKHFQRSHVNNYALSGVLEGGHNIPADVIARRYQNGLKNLFEIYSEIVDNLTIFNNSNGEPELIAEKDSKGIIKIKNIEVYTHLNSICHEKR